MRFEYEISENDYIVAQALYCRILQSRKRVVPLIYVAGGVLLCLMAWSERTRGWAAFLLAGLGVSWMYIGVVCAGIHSPSWWYRRAYRRAGVFGKRYIADVGADGFEVEGDVCSWRVRWQGVQIKGENERVFIFCAANTIFIFARKFLSEDQQRDLHRLSGLGS